MASSEKDISKETLQNDDIPTPNISPETEDNIKNPEAGTSVETSGTSTPSFLDTQNNDGATFSSKDFPSLERPRSQRRRVWRNKIKIEMESLTLPENNPAQVESPIEEPEDKPSPSDVTENSDVSSVPSDNIPSSSEDNIEPQTERNQWSYERLYQPRNLPPRILRRPDNEKRKTGLQFLRCPPRFNPLQEPASCSSDPEIRPDIVQYSPQNIPTGNFQNNINIPIPRPPDNYIPSHVPQQRFGFVTNASPYYPNASNMVQWTPRHVELGNIQNNNNILIRHGNLNYVPNYPPPQRFPINNPPPNFPNAFNRTQRTSRNIVPRNCHSSITNLTLPKTIMYFPNQAPEIRFRHNNNVSKYVPNVSEMTQWNPNQAKLKNIQGKKNKSARHGTNNCNPNRVPQERSGNNNNIPKTTPNVVKSTPQHVTSENSSIPSSPNLQRENSSSQKSQKQDESRNINLRNKNAQKEREKRWSRRVPSPTNLPPSSSEENCFVTQNDISDQILTSTSNEGASSLPETDEWFLQSLMPSVRYPSDVPGGSKDERLLMVTFGQSTCSTFTVWTAWGILSSATEGISLTIQNHLNQQALRTRDSKRELIIRFDKFLNIQYCTLLTDCAIETPAIQDKSSSSETDTENTSPEPAKPKPKRPPFPWEKDYIPGQHIFTQSEDYSGENSPEMENDQQNETSSSNLADELANFDFDDNVTGTGSVSAPVFILNVNQNTDNNDRLLVITQAERHAPTISSWIYQSPFTSVIETPSTTANDDNNTQN